MRPLSAILVFLFTPAASLAWGADGHRIVCEIAWQEMGPATRRGISELLAGDPDAASFPEACVWPDKVVHERRYQRDRARHYINLPKSGRGVDRSRDCQDACVVEGIETYTRILLGEETGEDRSRLEALKFLAHLIGDIHEPLHAGYAEDRGGNEIRIRYYGRKLDLRGEEYNLHKLWDTLMIRETGVDWKDLATELGRSITEAERRAWKDPEVLLWVDESFRIAQAEVYILQDGDSVGRSYYERHIGTVKRRLQQAGVRLGLVLDKVFSGAIRDLPYLRQR